MWEYSEKVKDLYRNPVNVGEVENYNAIGQVGNLKCGDTLRLTLKINEQTEIIEDAKIQTFGCGSAVAAGGALTLMIIGKSLQEAEKVTNKQIVEYLDGLPVEKIHCSVLGSQALREAIKNYRDKKIHPLDPP